MAGTSVLNASGTWILSGRIRDSDPLRKEAISTFPFRIGRRSEATLCLPCPSISGLHAEIYLRHDRPWVRDLRSTNGTFVNGNRIIDDTPIYAGDILQFANVVFRVEQQTVHQTVGTIGAEYCDQALSVLQFDKLMRDRAVVPYFQPIVDMSSQQTIGYEILGRSRLFGLQSPKLMFNAASQLNLEAELSELFREEGMAESTKFGEAPHLFLNTHPIELEHPLQLMKSLKEMRLLHPSSPITLEIHESAVTNSESMRELRNQLKDLNIGLAYDDFGQGQARLIELVEVPPDFLKFDMQLVQGICKAPRERRNMLEMFVSMVRDLGIEPLAEGVEDAADQEVCSEIGFKLSQGYLFGKPAPASRYV